MGADSRDTDIRLVSNSGDPRALVRDVRSPISEALTMRIFESVRTTRWKFQFWRPSDLGLLSGRDGHFRSLETHHPDIPIGNRRRNAIPSLSNVEICEAILRLLQIELAHHEPSGAHIWGIED